MSRSQTTQNFFVDYRALESRVSRLERTAAAVTLKSVDTTGLTSAQIDAAVFGASTNAQPSDGLVIVDTTNDLILARVGGKWGYASLSIIT